MEQHFFFEIDGRRLFAFLHSPHEARKTGFVFCSPFVEEKVRAQRLYVNFARLLASYGYPVIRFDYRGHGDSEGSFENTTLDTMIRDTQKARDVLATRAKVESFCLFGARVGGTVAALSSRHDDSIKALLLWDPILDGYAYMYKLLRTNIAMQTLRYKKVLYNREQLVDMMRRGEYINLDGYRIGIDLYESVAKASVTEALNQLPDKIAVVEIAKKELPDQTSLREFVQILVRSGKSAVYLELDGSFSWESQRFYRPKPRPLLDHTLVWVTSTMD